MKTLIEKIAAYKKVTQSLIDKTKEYEEFIKKEIPFELWDKFAIKKCGNGQHEDYVIKINGSLIPGVANKLGKGFYWAGDFNYWYDYVTGGELIEWAKQLLELITKAKECIDTLTVNAKEVNHL